MAGFLAQLEYPRIGYVSPEAAEGGPIAFVNNGDIVSYDIFARRLDLEV